MDKANEQKHAKYQELVEQCKKQGWQAHCEPIEVSCRKFERFSLCKALMTLGVTSAVK